MTENVIPRIPQLDYDPEWGDLFGAAFRRENFVGSAIQKAKNSSLFGEDDPTPVTDTDINLAVDQAKLAPFIEHFTQVSTRGELNRKIAHIRQQAEDKAILDKGGWSGFGASLVAGVLDVPTLVPFGHAVRLGRLGTESLKTTSSKLAMMAALDATATETGLQLTQDLREMEESALTVGGSVVLTTLLGTGIARYLSRRHFDDLSKRVEIELPKIADGRAEIEMADQVAQASANTARAISGDRLEMQPPVREFAPGERAKSFLDEQGIKPGLDDVDTTIGLRSLLIDADGAIYDLNRKFATHADWMRAVDDAGDNVLSGDMANVLQATLSREIVDGKPVVTFATGSQSPLTRKQLRGIRELAKTHGIDNRDLYVRESRNGDVEVLALSKEQASQSQFADFKSLSRYESAENRARAAEKAGAPPQDPELRQGVPTTRWDGEAQALSPTDGTGQIAGQGGGGNAGGNAGGTGGGGGQGSGQLPPGGPPPKSIESEFAPKLTPSQMAFAESGGSIGATRGLSRLFGRSPILELMNSTSTAARAWIMTVAELPARTKAAYEGRVNPIAVQSRMAEYEGMRAVMTREFNDAYKGWRQGLDVMGRDYENFSRNVSQALVRWNLDEVDPHVARAAKSIRDTIAKMYERAVEQGLIRKDAWKPGESKNPFVDYNDIRRRAEDASWSDPNAVDIYRGGFDPKDAVDDFLSELAKHEPGKPGKKSKGAVNKITNLNSNMDRLSATDAELYRQISRDVSSGGAALADNAPAQFVPEAGSRLVRGGQTGERGLDYNVGLRFDFGPNGELGDNLIQTGGLINRRYTDRLAHEHDAFMRAETLAELQDRDAVIRNARKWNEEQIAKAREDAKAKGEDPDKAAEDVVLDPNGTKGKMWHELSTSQKKMRLMSAMNHAKGAWEFIVHGTIRGGDSRVLHLEGAGRRSPLHRRNVKLSDEVLLAKGWIDDDALGIANHTVRQIASDVELARVFRRPMDAEEVRNAALGKPEAWWVDGKDPTTVPDLGMDVPRAVIGKEFDDAMAKLGSGPENDAARNAIRNERAMVLGGSDANGKQMQGLLDTVVEMVRGTHKVSENSTYAANNLDAARSYMFATRMGANVITSIGDIGAVTMNSGAPSLFKNFAVRARDLVSSLASPEAIANLATKWELPQDRVGALLAREARAAGIAVETDLMSRMASQMDLMDPFLNAKRKDTSFQQIASWLAKTGSKVYFINAWTNMVRRASYGIYVDRVVRAAMDPTQIAKHERTWLNDLGIDDKMLAGIRREVTENGGAEFDGGVWHLNHERWGDERLRSDFWAAGRKDANNSNVNPSQLEKPLAFTNPIVNTLLQFWSFSFGATMRIMGRSAQRIINGTDGINSDGTRVMLGLATMVGLGMSTFALHNYASTWRARQNGTLDPKDELPDLDNWRQWMLQGTSRSGVLGVFGQINDVMDNVGISAPNKIIRSFDPDPDLTDPIKKYGRPNAVKNLTGPTAGLIDDVISTTRGIAYGTLMEDQQLRRSHVRALARNTPFINAFYLKALTREALEHLSDDVLQLPPDRK